ncbi:MAG TPA: hypothetical protein VFQ78_06645 [Candidatus Udaeobacter sp.]|nr:hypothetical protein [Candidatus Udaeobacter sp.]
MRQKYVLFVWSALHLLLIVSFSCSDTLQLLALGQTILPSWFKEFSKPAETIVSTALGQSLSTSNPVREALVTYLHVAGIETGYGYFAPNVPGSYKVVFELRYADGRVQYELPSVRSAAAGLRIAGMLDGIGRTPYDALREILVKTLAQSVWHEHPDVESVRAIIGSIRLPTTREFKEGQRESYEFLYAYDFSVDNAPGKTNDR